jgi:hypothetical protein
MLGKTTIRNPAFVWWNVNGKDTTPARRDPPPRPFIVTRSEVRISRRSTAVWIWYELIPDRAAAHP